MGVFSILWLIISYYFNHFSRALPMDNSSHFVFFLNTSLLSWQSKQNGTKYCKRITTMKHNLWAISHIHWYCGLLISYLRNLSNIAWIYNSLKALGFLLAIFFFFSNVKEITGKNTGWGKKRIVGEMFLKYLHMNKS